MHTGILNIKDIFGHDQRLVVPLFQRPYVWKRDEQWELLWEDVRRIAERLLDEKPVRHHFLGAIVLDQVFHPTGHLENRLIIDGQQRLSTIQIVLEAFADACATVRVDNYHRALLKLTRNDDPLSYHPDDKFKVWPTNVDQEQFRLVMQVGSPGELARCPLQPPHLIADAYCFFYESIFAWLAPATAGWEQRREALYTTLCQHVRMVVIDLENDDDAQLIFETLNARGTPLFASDLVKNFLLRKAAQEGDSIDHVYEQHWRAFDEKPGYWRRELGPGHAKRARIDLYLQHYLTLKTRDEVPVAHLYAGFREYATHVDPSRASSHLQSLQRYAQVYESFDKVDQDTRTGLFFVRLGQMDITTAHPFLLELFTLYGAEHPQVELALVYIESFLVRRMVCHLTTRGYNRLFIDLLGVLNDTEGELASRIREFLTASDAESSRWPDDVEFRQAWLDMPLYRVLKRGRIRMVLEAIEDRLGTPYHELVKIKSRLTIEHLLPQGWPAHWPLPTSAPAGEAQVRRETLLHTLGNLTMVTGALNPAASNAPWPEKQSKILKGSRLLLNQQLRDYCDWDEDAIVRRGEALFEFAKQIWLFP